MLKDGAWTNYNGSSAGGQELLDTSASAVLSKLREFAGIWMVR